MSYYIDIVDTLSVENSLKIELAAADSVVLKWNGSDHKDSLAVVTSDLNIDILAEDASDAAFINFFTGDEKRFRVYLKESSNDQIIWQGFILPDLYSEPYKAVNFFVSIGATDGLNRLKGKYLSDVFYYKEQSCVAVICEILNLIGLDLDLYLSPAIENAEIKDWNEIFIDTVIFKSEGDKRLDAYSVLELLLKDMLCVCFQADNRWYVEGINVRQFRKTQYSVYNTGTVSLLGIYDYDRLLKKSVALAYPGISVIPPYNEILVSHKKVTPNFPETIVAEKNDGWAIVSGVKGEVYSTDWIGFGGMLELCVAPTYSPRLYHQGSENRGAGRYTDYPEDYTRFISLRKKIFYKKGQRINILFEFSTKKYYDVIPTPDDLSVWKNMFKYEIIFNGQVIYSNADNTISYFEDLNFDSVGKATLSIDHVFLSEGLFDVKIYGLSGVLQDNNIEYFAIDKADINVYGFDENPTEIDLIDGDFSVDKEVDLTISDDSSGMSSAFRLRKLNEETTTYVRIDVPVLHSFTLNNKKYLQLDLAGVNLIAENIYSVFSATDDANVLIVDAFYNFKDGEQMVIEVLDFYTELYVKKYASDDVTEARLFWEQWTDVIYKIERSGYSKTVANIYRRMFNTAVNKIDLSLKMAVKFNDLILFNYGFDKYFHVLNCSWNIASNVTEVAMAHSFYKDAKSDAPNDVNIPPIVVAADDIYMTTNQSTAVINAAAYDPDGYIVSAIWTKEVGGFGAIINDKNSLSTSLSNLTENHYRYKIEVVDSDGATAVDYIDLYRILSSNVSFALIYEDLDNPLVNFYSLKRYKLIIDPNLEPNTIVSFSGLLKAEVIYRGAGDAIVAECGIIKNGVIVSQCYVKNGRDLSKESLSYSFNVISTDEVVFYTRNSIKDSGSNYSYCEVNLGTYVVAVGDHVLSGLPIQFTDSLGTA